VTRTAFFGYGPDSYTNAFHLLKPLWLNNAAYWQSSFDAAFNLPLTMVVTIGGVGLLLWLWVCYRLVKIAVQSRLEQKSLSYFIIALLLWQFFLPVGPVFFGMLFIAAAFLVGADARLYKVKSYSFDFFNQQGERHQLVDRIFTGVAVVVAGLATFLLVNLSRSFIASQHIYQANAALLQEDAVKAYESWQQAANIAPRLDFVRRNYAMLNLEIAIALSNKTDATAAEQEQVVQLVNQAIREARAASTLDPANYQNWLVLAQIYTQLIESSEQAAQESFDALANAVNANPNDPTLRMSLGELFVMLEKPNDAIVFFNQAIERKPDLVAAYYSLAQVLVQVNALTEAEQALVTTLSLLEADSEEYRLVQGELEKIKEALANQPEEGQSNAPLDALAPAESATASSSLGEILEDSFTDESLREQAVDSDLGL
jgi:cytochrome c-type biogenesis protein CcmH/NrfG